MGLIMRYWGPNLPGHCHTMRVTAGSCANTSRSFVMPVERLEHASAATTHQLAGYMRTCFRGKVTYGHMVMVEV